MKELKRLLIANRGEIASRIATSCRVLGIESVCIYSREDANLPYVYEADHAYPLIGEGVSDTYLNISQIIGVAKQAKAQAIHPGYGFLSEQVEFSKAVNDAGMIFIGPSTDVLSIMGDKIQAREKMQSLNIPLLPGCHDTSLNDQSLLAKAKEIGFPVLIKASAGGGGRAMSICEDSSHFIKDLKAIRNEAEKLFGSDLVYIEKYLKDSKHLEVQVLSDAHGHHLHCHERDCSVQRRKQKVIEEAPSPNLSSELREYLCKVSIDITEGLHYLGAGTLEFIQDVNDPKSIFFLEMNTRIQVEHVVSEVITQIDLVAWQIRACMGYVIPFQQKDLTAKGHSIELRLYAEDPEANFFPTAGKLNHCLFSGMAQCRWDYTYECENEISLLYDSMIGKLIVWDETRELAIRRAILALERLKLSGLDNNRDHLIYLLKSEVFQSGKMTTTYIEDHPEAELEWGELGEEEQAQYLAAYFLSELNFSDNKNLAEPRSEGRTPWNSDSLNNFRVTP